MTWRITLTGLRIFTGNKLEILIKNLAETLLTPLKSPFTKEIIVVQSRGMEKWVRMELAGYHGICANCAFPFPNAFVNDVFRKVLPDIPESSPFNPKIMTWKIMKLLPSCIMRPGFENLRTYLEDAKGDLKRYQLSERIADTFDQYLLFRPQWIFQWEQGREDHWQAVLWRELSKGNKQMHRAAMAKEFLKTLGESSTLMQALPERVSIFGISALPRFHMQILAALAGHTQMNLFLMNPCKEYWSDIVSDWELERTTRMPGQNYSPEELHLEKGNSLLGSMGTLGRDFFDLLTEFDSEEHTSFEDYKGNSLLSFIQSDILNLRDTQKRSGEKRAVESKDRSVRIHSCHSPMREIEVLHDQLLHMFEQDRDLTPGDILVMTPDIETYSPYIHAVFDAHSNNGTWIPFSVADRSIRMESRVIDVLPAILDLKANRFSVSQVMAILESGGVRLKFAFSETDLALISKWLKEVRIRWGINGQDRVEMGFPDFSENTWEAGLSRLLLGYAMPGQEMKTFGGILPYDQMEGNDVEVLGRLYEFTEKLFTTAACLDRPRTPKAWSEFLAALLEDFFLPEEDTEREIQVLRDILVDLEERAEAAVFDEEIDLNVIKRHLAHCLEHEGTASGFITGGVTFCAMLPMRSIPFKVICLVGMDNNAYPRQPKSPGFDLMAKHPKPGDRSRRVDDRYLFLETILSAREYIYISYVGQSIQDNSMIPPSVLVSELMDYIEQGFYLSGADIRAHIRSKHRLQAYSPEYFKKDGDLFSYSKENFLTAQAVLSDRRPAAPFISKGLSRPSEEEWSSIDINDLCRFFSKPAKFLLNRRLGIYMEKDTSILDDVEPFDIKALERYTLNKDLLEMRLAGLNLRDLLPLMRSAGRLPHGSVGQCMFEETAQGVEAFAQKIEDYTEKTLLDPLEMDLSISDFRLTGRIHAVYPERRITYRYAQIRPEDRLEAWIYHLALNLPGADDYPKTSILIGQAPKNRKLIWSAWEFSPVEDGGKILKVLIDHYRAGLIKPLPFFPRSSWEYAVLLLGKGRSQKDALDSAGNIWTGNEISSGECADRYHQICFGDAADPLDSEFQRIAEEVFGPLLDHQKEM